MTDPYIKLAEAKHWVGIPQSDTVDDARLSDTLDAACRFVNDRTGRTFTLDAAATPRQFRAERGVVWFDGSDIGSLSDLVVKTDDDGDGVFETTWAATDFVLEPLNGRRGGAPWGYDRLVAVDRVFPCHRVRPGVEVTARWGWPEVPHPIRQAVRLLTTAYWKRKDAPFGVAGFDQFGAIRVREDPDVANAIALYKRPGIG